LKEIFLKFDMTTDEDDAFIKEFGGALKEDLAAIDQVSSAGVLTIQRGEVREAVFALRKLIALPVPAEVRDAVDEMASVLEQHFLRVLHKVHLGDLVVNMDDECLGYVYKKTSSTDEA
jgi:hypothetical protein